MVDLKTKNLASTDILYLTLFTFIIGGKFFLNYWSYPEMYKFFYDLSVAFLVIFFYTSPSIISFVKPIFSVVWLVLSIFYLMEGNNKGLSYFPLLDFIMVYINMYIFRRKYGRDIIPPSLGRGYEIKSVSQTQNKSGTKEDSKYLKIIVWFSAFILVACLFLSKL